jgi:uncharacterized protein (DUF1499 family)
MLVSILMVLLLSGCGGTVPEDLGAKDEKLKACPETPNCVSTQAKKSDTEHRMEPIAYTDNESDAKAAIMETIEDSSRASILENGDDYVRAEFTSRVFRFVDDVEFYIDEEERLIHFRSASRIGSSDMGANRERMTELRKDLKTKLDE